MTRVRSIGFMLLIGMAVGPIAGSTVTACQPSFLPLGDEPVEIVENGLRMHLSGAAIGCQADLAGLKEEERAHLRSLLRQVLDEEHYYLMVKARDKAFRAKLSSRMNERLGRPVVSDVFLYGFGSGESFNDEARQ